jgi:hypothetical protein
LYKKDASAAVELARRLLFGMKGHGARGEVLDGEEQTAARRGFDPPSLDRITRARDRIVAASD